MNYSTGILILVLIVDWLMFLITFTIGTTLGCLAYKVMYGSLFWSAPAENTAIAIYMYLVIFIVGVIFSRNKEIFTANLMRVKDELNEKLEKQVARRTEELGKALDAKSYFLRNVNHEIRTPVQGITVLAAELYDNWDKHDESLKKKIVAELRKCSKGLYRLVTMVLDLSKFQAGKMAVDAEENEIIKCIREVIGEVKPLADEKKIKIDIDSKNDIKDKFVFDRDRIAQVLRNLLSNAIRYSDPRTKIKVRLKNNKFTYTSGKDIPGVEIAVIDEGVGIPRGEIGHIFEAFNQSTRTDNNAGGSGLGLSIAKEIIHAHRGIISAKNNLFKGSTFSFILPYEMETAV